MNARSLRVLEFSKVRERLARATSFAVAEELALKLEPSDDIREVEAWQAETSEAMALLDEKTDAPMGGVRDLRPLLDQARRGSPLLPADLLDIRSTLQRARVLQRSLTRQAERFPHVGDVAGRLVAPAHIIEAIGAAIDERAEVMDSASPDLGRIRHDLQTAHSRLMERLQRLVSTSTNAQYLQEAIVTQRHGRYVIPIRAEFKGRIPGLVHDQSGSGATLFIEPLAVVDLNNQWREAQLAEEEEIRKILERLTGLVAADAMRLAATVAALGELDFIFAKARFGHEISGVRPKLIAPPKANAVPAGQPAGLHPGTVIRLYQARHPLLDPAKVVPVDIFLDEDYFILLITGPNTGGKTVSLKTTGLLTLMAQSGLAIPAAPDAELSVFEDVLADIGDEQSIEQSLSTFSSHMSHIIQILKEADHRSLVLLDELGAGTDPEEGAALAQELLQTLIDHRVTTLATTHYSELKVFAHNTPYVENASVEFDIETLSPTYRLSIGLPGRSNAFAIAQRLGMPEDIVERAQARVAPEAMEAEALLADIKNAREAALAAESAAQLTQRHSEALNADLRYRLAKIEEARRAVLSEARVEAQAVLESLRDEVSRVREQATGISKGTGRHEAWLAEAENVLARRAAEARPIAPADEPAPLVIAGPAQVSDLVWVPSLQTTGEVVGMNGAELEVKIGTFRLRLAANRVEVRERGGRETIQSAGSSPMPPSPGSELDLRGLTVDDMLMELDRYLDTAYLAGLPYVRLIHGKGTGALRQAVREQLRQHPLVANYRSGENNEGGEGVTVATMAQHA